MTHRTVTVRKVPVFGLLDATTQKQYMQDGYLSPIEAEEIRDTSYNYHSVQAWCPEKQIDKYFLEELFDPELLQKCEFVEHGIQRFYLVTNDYGVFKIDVFTENWVIDPEEEYRWRIVARLLYCGHKIEFIGDANLISVTRKRRNQHG